MEKITIAKALKTIVLPNGKTVHEGDEFVYNHDFENAGEFEIVGEQNGNAAPENTPEALSVEEMTAIRMKAKELKIYSWHLKGIDKLIVEIAEAEAKEKDEITTEATETKENGEQNTPEGITTEIVTDPKNGEQEGQTDNGEQNNA